MLERGYAIVRARGRVLKPPLGLVAGERLDLQLAKGSLAARVEDPAPPDKT